MNFTFICTSYQKGPFHTWSSRFSLFLIILWIEYSLMIQISSNKICNVGHSSEAKGRNMIPQDSASLRLIEIKNNFLIISHPACWQSVLSCVLLVVLILYFAKLKLWNKIVFNDATNITPDWLHSGYSFNGRNAEKLKKTGCWLWLICRNKWGYLC